jgi:CMP-N-acetylneuraminic acid synthetase
MKNNIYFVIPARKGSKGFPLKNQKLMNCTFDSIPMGMKNVIVSTDDEIIMEEAMQCGYNVLCRDDKLADDHASTKDVLLDVVNQFDINKKDIIILLYLTYPFRTWSDISKVYSFFTLSHAKSLLCKYETDETPYLMMYEEKDNKGSQIFQHNLYRRQDYKKVFMISHYVFISYVDELKNLNKNLYNENTIFFPIEKPIDVDYKKDLENNQI